MQLKKIFLLFISVLLVLAVFGGAFSASAQSSLPEYPSYTYNADGEAIAAPIAYDVFKKISLANCDISVSKLSDFDIDADTGHLYLIDSELFQIIKFDINTNEVLSVVSTFSDNQTLKDPNGISVGADGFVYVADTGNHRVLKLDKDLNCVNIFGEPSLEDAQFDYEYKPLYVEADVEGRLYVIAESQTQGIMQFGNKGDFLGYYGATKVSPSVTELFFRNFASQEQLKGMLRFIPTEYRNMALDELGFMYCTISTYSNAEIAQAAKGGGNAAPIRRLNQSGSDILLRNGAFAPVGDIEYTYNYSDSQSGPSVLVDICSYKNGIYSVLDSKRGRVFTYNSQGDLLYIFGGRGTEQGRFISPEALVYHGDDILVLDSSDNSITCFAQTGYAKLINKGIQQYQDGNYSDETKTWNEVLKMFPHSVLALKGIGRSYYNNEDFGAALKYFKLAGDREYYSKALQEYIRVKSSEIMGVVLPIVAVLAVIAVVIWQLKKKGYIKVKKKNKDLLKNYPRLKKFIEEVKYSKYVSFHPFDGFWDLKHEKRGSVEAATFILVMAIVSNIIRIRWMPFLFNSTDFSKESALYKGIISIIALVALWCVSNWCLTTLMDGKGKMKDIYIYTCYSLRPIAILFPALTAVSYFLYIESATFLNILTYMIIVWVGFLIVAGTISTHHYTFGKAFVTIILTIVGMMIIAFLALLIFSIAQQAVEFFKLLFIEIASRI